MLKTLSALCAVAATCTMLGAPGAWATPATEAFIQQNFDKGYVILSNTSLSVAERREQFRALLVGLAATRRIALFTLGPYAADAAPADLDAFAEAFTNYSVAVYEKGLKRYGGETLKVTGSSDRAADDSIVQTQIISPNPSKTPPIQVAFRVRRGENGAPIITDIQIEGVSLAITERADFTAYLQQHNRSIPELTKSLGAMSEKLTGKAVTISAIY
jgi:phospholipid transport system substrate-binding protein